MCARVCPAQTPPCLPPTSTHRLCPATGIPGCVFVHASGFIGGNDTYEGAVEMARKALTLD